ncbi:MAG: glutamate--tRNA ligase [Planctomycetes bacterium]|nr:glutamate--tRNA ligase [Planctomycetota bacterium]MCB9909504.1 glutamate--tRNA ligase [Planctomycetota bacterium]MCB9912529.1 glutamate--tRNA ligase [Planctomycetota bacterium]
MSKTIRVRIAPSPTGSVHLGLCRTALFNWAYARRFGGQFVLRIEDTDHDRNTQVSEQAILAALDWLGLDYDEGPGKGGPFAPYRQSERVARHLEMAQALLASGHAYRDFSTPEALDAWRAEQEARKQRVAYRGSDRDLDPEVSRRRAEAGEPFATRFRIPAGETRFEDLIRGQVTIPHEEIDDWVMVRRGGEAPTYNFVVVCDDLDMQITHVFRGEEHLVNTPKQLLVYAACGKPEPAFAHLPLMLGTDRKKLSKRTGDTSLPDYQAKGYPKEAIFNFLALQGWSLDGETDVFDRAKFVEHFDIRDVSKAGAVFDPAKFLWMAGEYLRRETVEELAQHVAPFAIEAQLMTAEAIEARRPWFLRVVASVQDRMSLYSDFPAWVAHFFQPDDAIVYDEKAEKGARKREGRAEILLAFAEALEAGRLGHTAADMAGATKAWLEDRGAKLADLFQPLRLALTGMGGGPDLFETIELLSTPSSLARIRAGAARLA